MARTGKLILAAVVGGAVTIAVRRYLNDNPPGGAELWTRTNHRGEPISLLEGPAVTAGITAGSLFAPSGLSGAIAAAGGGAFGLYDDLAEDTSQRHKGFKGHLGALAQGELTTGGLKILGIGGTAFVSSCFLNVPRSGRNVFDVLLDTAVIAGSANFVNLLDLRPGRALKFAGASAALLGLKGKAPQSGAIIGACLAAAPGDLAEQDMLGDSGANALGALLGQTLASQCPRPVRLLGLAVLGGLTVASERVSFSKVIADTAWLNRIDSLGRRPSPVVAPEEFPKAFQE